MGKYTPNMKPKKAGTAILISKKTGIQSTKSNVICWSKGIIE